MTELMIAPTATIQSADRHPALVYLAALSASSRRTMGQGLNIIAGVLGIDRVENAEGKEVTYLFVPWGEIRYNVSQYIRTQLAERYSASTANRHLSALRGVLKDAWRLGYMTAEDYQRAIDLKAISGSKVSQAEAGRHLTTAEIGALITACQDGTKAGLRDAAIIAVGYGCGLRRSEIARFEMEDYDAVRESLRVRFGKGNKERVVYMPPGTNDWVTDWVKVRGNAPGALFYSVRRGDNVEYKGLTSQAIYNILASRAATAGVKAFTPHDLRRTFAGDMLDAGEDLSTVQKMMGHANADTTAGYDRRDSRTRKKASSKIHVPYRGQMF